jgi:hypothetical protein
MSDSTPLDVPVPVVVPQPVAGTYGIDGEEIDGRERDSERL